MVRGSGLCGGDGHDPAPCAAVGGRGRPSRRRGPPRPRAAGTAGNLPAGRWLGAGAAGTRRPAGPPGVPGGTRLAGELRPGSGRSPCGFGVVAAYRSVGPAGSAAAPAAESAPGVGFSLGAGSALRAGAFRGGRVRIPAPENGAGRRRPEYSSGRNAAAQAFDLVRECWTSRSTRDQARGDDAPGGRNGRSGSCHPGRGRIHRVSSWGHLSGSVAMWSRAPPATLLTTAPAIPGVGGRRRGHSPRKPPYR